jgi:hypothetical protein
VNFAGDRLSIRFDRFDPVAYALFLRCKKLPEYGLVFDPVAEAYTIDTPARFAPLLGIDRPALRTDLPIAGHLFDDQSLLCRQAIDAKRFALWCQCGWGKTPVGLEWARQVTLRVAGGRVLIVTLNEVVGQWIEEAAKWYGDALPLERLYTRSEMRDWCREGSAGIAVTNYEKFNPDELGRVVNECRHLAGVVLDEASRLKSGGGKQKWALIKSFKGVEYKLTLTATPAPNDFIEYASQAAFLEKMRTDADIIWTYFTRDPKSHRWTIKPHARAAFFEFMASWSVYVNDPKRYGWRAGHPDVPPPVNHVVEIEATPEQREAARAITADSAGQLALFPDEDTNTIQRAKLSQVAKGFVYRGGKTDKGGRAFDRIPSRKAAAVADIVKREAKAGAQVLVWTVFDAESTILGEALAAAKVKGVELLTGKTPKEARPDLIDRFRTGKTRVLVSRARLLGYGMNFQFCTAMVFSGWTDSFEDLYQAVRRAVRYGQTERVRVYFPMVRELEGDTFDNVERKWREFEGAIEEMEENYVRARGRLALPERAGAA